MASCRSRVPHAAEALKWGHPAYSLGTILFTPKTLHAFDGELDTIKVISRGRPVVIDGLAVTPWSIRNAEYWNLRRWTL